MASSPPPSWTAEIGQRMRRHFVLKFIGTSICCCVFFIGYFQVLRNPAYAVTVMPLTALDHWIPFQPWTLVAYLSLWVYVGMAPGLQWTLREVVVYALWMIALCLTGLGLFYAWPTQVPALVQHHSDFPGFALLRGVDAPQNACPSLHVATAMFTAIRASDVLRRARTPMALRLFNIAWFLAIAWSTLAIGQHVVMDVLAGALLGSVFAWMSLRWRPDPAAEMRRVAPRTAPRAAAI